MWLDIGLPPDLTKHLKVFSFYGMWISLSFFCRTPYWKTLLSVFVHVIC